MNDFEARFKELGLSLPPLPPAAGAYVPAVKVGNLVFCSGQGPYKDGSQAYIGKVGGDVSPEEGYQASRIAALNCLAEICSVIGSLNNSIPAHMAMFSLSCSGCYRKIMTKA